jgi:hypothetical protein
LIDFVRRDGSALSATLALQTGVAKPKVTVQLQKYVLWRM